MADDIGRIRRFLAGLVWRERLLLAARVAGRLTLVWAASFAWFSVVPHLQLERAVGLLLLVVGAGIGGWIAVALPLLREWRAAGDPLGQAARVEVVRPELRGRLVTAVDGTRGPVDPAREALLQLVVGRAVRGIQGVRAGQVHQVRRIVPAVATGALSVALGFVLFLALGPRTAVSWWFRGADALAAASIEMATGPTDEARVGDLVLEYTFPDYTGLEPKVVANGTGEVEAPPGTVVEVVARAADAAEAAGLVAYEESLEASLSEDGRGLSGRFTVRVDDGSWRFTVYRGGVAEPSRDFAITAQKDLPPDVTLSVGTPTLGDGLERIEVAVDQRFEAQWQARDDYGVRSVVLALDGKDGQVLERPERRRSDLSGSAFLTPRGLGLSPGARVQLAVVAWDNDTVSGSKRGESRPVELVVLGANGRDDQLVQRREDLLEAMLPILADNLVDPWPPGDSASQMAAWGEVVAARYRPLSELTDQLWAGMTRVGADRKVVEKVLGTGRDLVRYTQTAFEPGSDTRPPAESFQLAASLRTDAVEALENAILSLHRMIELRALGEVVRQAEQLSTAAQRMEQALANENPDLQELLSQLDQLERMMASLAKQAARLGESGLQEFVQSRQSEIDNLMQEIRKAIAEGRVDDARKMMERLTKMLREMSDGVEEQLESAEQESQDSEDQAAALQEELEALEKEQRALQSEVSQLREEDRSAGQAAAAWDELARKAEAHAKDAGEFRQGLATAGRPFHERERAGAGGDAADHLRESIGARDLRGARDDVGIARQAWRMERRAVEVELQRRQGKLPGPGVDDLNQLLGQLDAIEALLDQLETAESQMDPQTRERAKQLEQQQRDLQQRTQEALEKGRSLEQQFPVRPEGMRESLEDATQRMDQASEDLQEGQPMQAEGSQGMAAERLKEAAESLQEARNQAAQQRREMRQGQGGSEGSGGGEEPGEEEPGDGDQEGHQNSQSRDELEIPGRESFQTPEEYRRALLEGMEGEVPEEYRAMKKRYFEELVSQ